MQDNNSQNPSQPVQPVAAPTQPQPAPVANKPHILLVEDDPLLVKMYVTKFTMEGYELTTAGDGEEGLKKAIEMKPDFIILDVMMPKMSGTDMLEALRKTPEGKDIPVLVLTNLTQQDVALKLQQLGAKEYLVKAMLTPAQVVEKVRKYLGK